MELTATEHTDKLKEIESRLVAITSGNWRVVMKGDKYRFAGPETFRAEDDYHIVTDADLPNQEVIGTSEWLRIKPEDAEFIAHAPEDMRYVLCELRKTRSKLSELAEIADVVTERVTNPKGGLAQWGTRNHTLRALNKLRSLVGMEPVPLYKIEGKN